MTLWPGGTAINDLPVPGPGFPLMNLGPWTLELPKIYRVLENYSNSLRPPAFAVNDDHCNFAENKWPLKEGSKR